METAKYVVEHLGYEGKNIDVENKYMTGMSPKDIAAKAEKNTNIIDSVYEAIEKRFNVRIKMCACGICRQIQN